MERILAMPLSQFLGIRPSSLGDSIAEMPFSNNLKNHVGTFHASAILSFAEISCGICLAKSFPDFIETTLPVLRKAYSKFNAPASKDLFSTAKYVDTTIEEIKAQIDKHGRTSLRINVTLRDKDDKLVFKGDFDWFVSRGSAW